MRSCNVTTFSCILLYLPNIFSAFLPTESFPHWQRQLKVLDDVVAVVHQSSISVDVDAEGQIGPIARKRHKRNLAIGRPQKHVPLFQLALAGSATTFLADACIHPIDCIKTIQQSNFGAEMNFMEAATFLFETSGIRGFFNGLFIYACSDAVGGAIKFAFWETWKKKFDDPKMVWPGAALAFVAASVAIVPGEFFKQQLQMSHFDTLGEAMTSVYHADGLAGFFVGYDAVILRDVPHTMLELCFYDFFKLSGTLWPKSSGEPRDVHPLLAACMTGSIAGLATTPMDAIKTKIMVEGSYDSAWDCFAATVDAHGWGGIWAGALARVMWIAPFTMLYLPTYDFLHKTLLERHVKMTDFPYTPNLSNIENDN